MHHSLFTLRSLVWFSIHMLVSSKILSDSLPTRFFPVAVPDTVHVMHSQINLLRQTILDLRETEAHEIADLRRQMDALEKPGADGAKARFDDLDTRLRAAEQQPRGGGGMVRD